MSDDSISCVASDYLKLLRFYLSAKETAMTQLKTRKMRVILATALTVIALGATDLCGDVVLINRSDSLPHGLYVIAKDDIHSGAVVEFAPPQIAVDYAIDRWGNMPSNVQFLKSVVAVEGDHVDATGDTLLINGVAMGTILEKDSAGNSLPRWKESRVLRMDEIYVFSDHDRGSFDSRYYGPIHRNDVLSVRRPLWVW